jgi:hypothetical protein
VADDEDLSVRGVRGGGWKGEAVRLGVYRDGEEEFVLFIFALR